MFWVYILRSTSDGSYYVGYTSDLNLRLYKHNSGQSLATKRKRPWKVVYFEKYNSKSHALKREIQIKTYKGGQAFKKLLEKAEVLSYE